MGVSREVKKAGDRLLFNTFVSYKCLFRQLGSSQIVHQTFVNKLHFSFPPKSFSPMLFVMTPINAVIPMMRAATVIKSIKKQSFENSPLPVCMFIV